jgi:hypothetical protein
MQTSVGRITSQAQLPVGLLLIGAMVISGCGSTRATPATQFLTTVTPTALAATTAPVPTEAAASDPSAWEQVLEQIDPDGSVTAETALEAFSLAFGPLPGVTVPVGPLVTIQSGSGAIRWLVGHWNEITDAQRAEAVRLVPELAGVRGTRSSAPRRADGLPENGGAVATVRPATYYAVLAQTMADEIQAHTHLTLTLTLFAEEGRTQNAKALADAGVYNAQGGTDGEAAKCIITVSPLGAALSGEKLEMTIAHEVWHCYQAQIRGMDWYYAQPTPTWLIEGQAEWVGDALRPGVTDQWWQAYIKKPERALFRRSYDAIGFYAHLMQAQINTWDVLVLMVQADDDNASRYKASGATSDQFLDTWASGYFREVAIGPAWEFEGPGLPDSGEAVPLLLSVANGTAPLFASPSYANAIYVLVSSADIVEFSVDGHARLGDPGTGQEYVLQGSAFCTKVGGCTCPPGTEFAGAPPNRLSAQSHLAITGGSSGTHGIVTGHALEEYCHGGNAWSMIFWSPDLGDSAPPLMVAYTCDGLVSTWKVIHLPGGGDLEEVFDLPFGDGPTVHRDFHYDVPASKQSNAQSLDYALDFTLDPNANPPVITVSGTKTVSEGVQSQMLAPREFGSVEPLQLKNVALETQLEPYPKYQHPFRAQALAECGGN